MNFDRFSLLQIEIGVTVALNHSLIVLLVAFVSFYFVFFFCFCSICPFSFQKPSWGLFGVSVEVDRYLLNIFYFTNILFSSWAKQKNTVMYRRLFNARHANHFRKLIGTKGGKCVLLEEKVLFKIDIWISTDDLWRNALTFVYSFVSWVQWMNGLMTLICFYKLHRKRR